MAQKSLVKAEWKTVWIRLCITELWKHQCSGLNHQVVRFVMLKMYTSFCSDFTIFRLNFLFHVLLVWLGQGTKIHYLGGKNLFQLKLPVSVATKQAGLLTMSYDKWKCLKTHSSSPITWLQIVQMSPIKYPVVSCWHPGYKQLNLFASHAGGQCWTQDVWGVGEKTIKRAPAVWCGASAPRKGSGWAPRGHFITFDLPSGHQWGPFL